MTRTCLRCGTRFCDPDEGAFVTCPSCRHPLTADSGGCHHWESVSEGHRATKERDLKPEKQSSVVR